MYKRQLKHYGDQLGDKIVELEKEIYEDANETFNINSPKQLGVVHVSYTHLDVYKRQGYWYGMRIP